VIVGDMPADDTATTAVLFLAGREPDAISR
jgi:hypothetical protein